MKIECTREAPAVASFYYPSSMTACLPASTRNGHGQWTRGERESFHLKSIPSVLIGSRFEFYVPRRRESTLTTPHWPKTNSKKMPLCAVVAIKLRASILRPCLLASLNFVIAKCSLRRCCRGWLGAMMCCLFLVPRTRVKP